MLVREGDRTCLEAPAKAELADSIVTRNCYTQLPQIRLTGNSTGHPLQPETTAEVMLDGNVLPSLVECAIRHLASTMRYAVLAAIWNHPDSFRQIFQFGLEAPPGFPESRKIVAEKLDKRSATLDPASNRVKLAVKTLLPRMPLPAHLRDRERK